MDRPPEVARSVSCLLLIVLLMVYRAEGQSPGPPLSLENAIDRALAQYPAVRAASAIEAGARAELGEAEAARRPVIRAHATITRYRFPMIVSPIHGFLPGFTPPFDQTLLQANLNADYALYDGGGRKARIDQTRSQVQATEASSAGTESLVMMQVVAAYSRILGRKQVLDAHDRRLAALEAERGRVEQLLQVGRAAQIEVLRVSAAIESARAERVQIAEAMDIAERDLARLIGGDPSETQVGRLAPFSLADRGIPEREGLFEAALISNPAVQEARRRLTAAEAAVRVAQSARRPRLNALANFLEFASADGQSSPEWNVGIQVSLPILDSATGYRIARARAAREAASEQVRNVELEIRGEFDRALSSLREAAARLTSLESTIAHLTEVVRIEQLRLDAGTGIQTDYLDAEASLLSARASLADAQYGEVIARVELARVTGLLDPATLQRIVRVQP